MNCATSPHNWSFRRPHAALLLAGIVLRLAFSFTVNTEDSYAGWDGHEFHQYAINLLHFAGDNYARTLNAVRSPGYPIFLMPFVAINQDTTVHIQIAQCLLGAILALILGRIAGRWGGQDAGNFAFAMALFFPPLIYYSAFVLTEVLFSVLLWGGVACFQELTSPRSEERTRAIVWAGVLFGMACLVRPGLQLFLPIAALWVGWRTLRDANWKQAVRQTAILAAVVSSLLLPWLVGNFWAHGDFSLAPGEPQALFFFSNSPEYLQMYEATTKHEYYRANDKLSDLISVNSDMGRESWVRAALDFRRSHTRDWLRLQWYKTQHFWTPWLNPVIFERKAFLISVFFTTPLFVLAACELWRRRRTYDAFLVLLLGILGIGYLTGGLIFHAQVRYRIPYVEVTFILLASCWASRYYRSVSEALYVGTSSSLWERAASFWASSFGEG